MDETGSGCMKVYHGSYCEVRVPDLNKSRTDIDFGVGFYTTEDDRMARKWACNKKASVLNEYEMNFDGLKTIKLSADDKWFDYVLYNRGYDTEIREAEELKHCDAIIGPTADDRMFFIFEMYNNGLVSKENAIKILNVMNYSPQVVLKSEKAIKQLHFLCSKEIKGAEKDNYLLAFRNDSANSVRKTNELLKRLNRGEPLC